MIEITFRLDKGDTVYKQVGPESVDLRGLAKIILPWVMKHMDGERHNEQPNAI